MEQRHTTKTPVPTDVSPTFRTFNLFTIYVQLFWAFSASALAPDETRRTGIVRCAGVPAGYATATHVLNLSVALVCPSPASKTITFLACFSLSTRELLRRVSCQYFMNWIDTAHSIPKLPQSRCTAAVSSVSSLAEFRRIAEHHPDGFGQQVTYP